jgi:hypothetical protein
MTATRCANAKALREMGKDEAADDLDAPDLGAGGNADPKSGLDMQTSTKPVADERPIARLAASRKARVIRPPSIVLATDESEALRDRLVAELADLKSADEAADWVQKNLAEPGKSGLWAMSRTILRRSSGRSKDWLPDTLRCMSASKPGLRDTGSIARCRRSGTTAWWLLRR